MWLKRATTTPPPGHCTALWGEGGATSTALKICLIKHELHKIIIKSILKMSFLIKTSETKKFFRIFARHLRFKKKKIFCLSHPGLILIFTKRLFKFPSSEDEG
jgi:hypothetical protein